MIEVCARLKTGATEGKAIRLAQTAAAPTSLGLIYYRERRHCSGPRHPA